MISEKPLATEDEISTPLSLLKEEEAPAASALTKRCAGISRGFSGEDTSFLYAWMKKEEASLIECQAQDAVIFCVRENARVCGIAMAAIYGEADKKTVWLRLLAVDPNMQHRGIGQQLLDQVITYGFRHQARQAFLAADCCNTHAIHLYEQKGFVMDETDGELTMCAGSETTSIYDITV